MKKVNETREHIKKEFLAALSEPRGLWDSGWKLVQQEKNITGNPYRGVNAFFLNMVASGNKYDDNRWFTFNKVREISNSEANKGKNIHVKKGEKACYVEKWYCKLANNTKDNATFMKRLAEANKAIGKPLKNSKGYVNNYFELFQIKIIEEKTSLNKSDFFLDFRSMPVFNGSQIENLEPPKLYTELDQMKIEIAEKTLMNYMEKQNIPYSNELNCTPRFNFALDDIKLPLKKSFTHEEHYISTLCHEVAHSTGMKSRLNRPLVGMGNPEERLSYATEELIAELASVMLCSELDVEIAPEHIENHKEYVKSWYTIISNEEKGEQILFHVMKEAEKAADFVKEQGDYEKVLEEAMQKQGIELETKEPIEVEI